MSDFGFLHLQDLLDIHNVNPIFSTPPYTKDDVDEKMREQIKDEKGVGFDLRLGSQFYLSGQEYPQKLDEGGRLTINPGQFALLTTYEIFHVPADLVAFISMRFSKKAQGLINVSGFQVDPGFEGIFVFAVYNAGPLKVSLDFKEEIYTVIFAKTSREIKRKRSVQNEIPKSIWTNIKQAKNISSVSLDERITTLENWRKSIRYWIPTAAAIAAVIVTVIDLAFKYGGRS
jgi:dCTP deaminase